MDGQKDFSGKFLAAEDCGEWLGVSDWLGKDEFAERLMQLLSVAHEEIRRIDKEVRAYNSSLNKGSLPLEVKPMVAKVKKEALNRRKRLKGLRRRITNRELSRYQAFRVFLWILLKSPKEDREKLSNDEELLDPEQQARTSNQPKVNQMPLNVSSRMFGDLVIRDSISSGNYENAYIWGRVLFPKHQDNKGFVSLLEKAATKRGNLSQVVAINRYRNEKKWITDNALRVAEGRLNEIRGIVPKLRKQPVPVGERNLNMVLHFAKESVPYYSNGFCSRSLENLKAESRAGFDPVVITEPGFPPADLYHGSEHEVVDGIPHLRILPGQDELVRKLPLDEFNALYATMALKAVLKLKPGILHASSGRRGYETALATLAIGDATGIPVVYEVRSSFTANWTGELKRGETGEIFHRRVATEMECIHRADHVVVICDTLKKQLVGRGVPEGKISVVPNGVDVEQFQPKPKNQQLGESLGIGNSTVIGYVSNMDHPRESQETIVVAAKLLLDRGYDVKVLLVGKGNRLKPIRDLSEKLGIGDKVITPGSVDHSLIADYYRLIDLFIVPRIDERAARWITPLKPYEAMAAGIPVIASNLPALDEIVNSPERGLLFEPGNSASLARIVVEALEDKKSTKRRAETALKWVRETRQWSNNSSIYKDVYEKIKES